MTDTTSTITREAISVRGGERWGFRRVAAISGIVTVIFGLFTGVMAGTVPVLGSSAGDLAAYYAANTGPHRLAVVISALLALPITIFLVGVYRSLATEDDSPRPAWATVFLYGAIMASATAGLREGLYAIAVRFEGTGLEPGTLQLLNDGSQIAGATLGAWLAVAVGSVAVATFLSSSRTRWYAWFCTVVATLGIVSVIDTVSVSTGGVFAMLGFAGFVLWVLTTGIVMYRRPLMS